MTISPPKPKISPESPFEEALFGRKDFAISLTNLLQSVQENLVVFINAPWGSGKTTFAEMWQAQLKKEKQVGFIYFDAFASDYFDDPFVSFTDEILCYAKTVDGGKNFQERKDLKKAAISIGTSVGGLLLKTGVKAVTLGAMEGKDVKEACSAFAEGIAEIGAKLVEKKIEHYTEEKDALGSFRKSLQALAAKVRAKQKGFPLTIVVDELDRCRPAFALGLLERVKHLFNVEGVAFVLLVNRNQLESYIQTVYGNADAEAYLLKFGALFVDLPNQDSFFYPENSIQSFCDRLTGHYQIEASFQISRQNQVLQISSCVALWATHLHLTLREMENVYATLALYYASTPGEYRSHPALVAIASVLKVKKFSIFKSLRDNHITAQELFKEIDIDHVSEPREGLPWVKAFLVFCLTADSDTETSEFKSGLNAYRASMTVDRHDEIPNLCWRLERFSWGPPS